MAREGFRNEQEYGLEAADSKGRLVYVPPREPDNSGRSWGQRVNNALLWLACVGMIAAMLSAPMWWRTTWLQG